MPANPPASGARDPRWRPEQQFTALELPAAGRSWLLDNDSLSARLIALDAGEFSVRRLYQGWQVPLPSEQTLLQVSPRQRAMVREVLLRLDERAVVFARSVFPISSLRGELAHLRKLQNRSLGAILFRFPAMLRSPFELARVTGDSAYMAPWVHQQGDAWARRSCFDIGGKRLLVSEVFLQGFTPWNAALPLHRSQRGKVSAAIGGVKQ